MEEYFPEYLMAYIAICKEHRGKGLGSDLLKRALRVCKGDIAVRIKQDLPAKLFFRKKRVRKSVFGYALLPEMMPI